MKYYNGFLRKKMNLRIYRVSHLEEHTPAVPRKAPLICVLRTPFYFWETCSIQDIRVALLQMYSRM